MSEVNTAAPAAAAPAESTPSAPAQAPAAPASGAKPGASSAVNEVLNSLPKDQKSKDAAPVADDSADDVEDDGADLEAEEKAPKSKKEEAKKAYKLKVGGKDVEVDEAELIKRAQMGTAADQKWQEAAQMRKQAEAFFNLLQSDPGKALEKLGFDVDKLAEERIRYRIEEMQKSPEQLERERIQRELEELKAERERERNEIQEREKARLQQQYAIEIENDIASALDNNAFGMPKSPYVVKRIADTMILAVQEGIRTNNQSLKNITAKDVLPIVQEEIKRELAEMYSIAPDDVFEQLVGKERLNKYRKAKVKKTAPKPPTAADVKPTGLTELAKAQDDQKPQKMSAKQFFKSLGTGKV